MDFDDQAVRLLIEYHAAHLSWKSLPIGPQKVEAKRVRGQLHGKVMKLCKSLAERKPP